MADVVFSSVADVGVAYVCPPLIVRRGATIEAERTSVVGHMKFKNKLQVIIQTKIQISLFCLNSP